MVDAGASAPRVLYTIGHGNRMREQLVAMLREAGVAALVDVRARPRSRRNPQFDREALAAGLRAHRIDYHWAGQALGGMRRSLADSPHIALEGSGMRGYADHMASESWLRGAAGLESLASDLPTAMMCAEIDPRRCHRDLIADWMLVRGARVVHLLAPGEHADHVLTLAARQVSGRLVYDRGAQPRLI